jgi:hypothetical protein
MLECIDGALEITLCLSNEPQIPVRHRKVRIELKRPLNLIRGAPVLAIPVTDITEESLGDH